MTLPDIGAADWVLHWVAPCSRKRTISAAMVWLENIMMGVDKKTLACSLIGEQASL
jgi:hypothetical protein